MNSSVLPCEFRSTFNFVCLKLESVVFHVRNKVKSSIVTAWKQFYVGLYLERLKCLSSVFFVACGELSREESMLQP